MRFLPVAGAFGRRTTPEHTPPGSQYDLIGYSLFEDFQLIELAGAKNPNRK